MFILFLYRLQARLWSLRAPKSPEPPRPARISGGLLPKEGRNGARRPETLERRQWHVGRIRLGSGSMFCRLPFRILRASKSCSERRIPMWLFASSAKYLTEQTRVLLNKFHRLSRNMCAHSHMLLSASFPGSTPRARWAVCFNRGRQPSERTVGGQAAQAPWRQRYYSKGGVISCVL